ncbi:hypothetical protein KY358_00670 [Candidatus Woesearchaeota archaeon]|nr:hypothetical protein [Candidatus Woesearchaeota archaeon]
MKAFRKVLDELNVIVDEVLAFDIILTSVMIFLGFYLALMLISLNPWYSLFPTLVYLAFMLYIDLNTNKYKMVENRYAPLYEKLRTAADNVSIENEVVDELEHEVVSELKNVRLSSFVKISRVSYKVLGSMILCLIILFASMFNVNFGGFNAAFEKIREMPVFGVAGEGKGELGDKLAAGTTGEGEDIYGEESIAMLGNQEVEIRIKQPSIEVVGAMAYEIPDKEFEEAFPDEIFTSSSGSYEEKITIENQKLVKDYFNELSKG